MSRILITTFSFIAFAGFVSAQGARIGTSVVEKAHVTGAVVDRVAPHSPAEESGIEIGDVIVKMGGSDITNLDSFTKTFDTFKPGDAIEVSIRKGGADGELKTLKVTLGKAGAPPAEDMGPESVNILTPTVRTERADRAVDRVRRQAEKTRTEIEKARKDQMDAITKAVEMQENAVNRYAYLGVVSAEEDEKVMIADVVDGSAAAKAGLQKGDHVYSIGENKVMTRADLQKAIRAHAPGEKVKIQIEREGKDKTLVATLGEVMDSPMEVVATQDGVKIERGGQPDVRIALPDMPPAPAAGGANFPGIAHLQKEIVTLRAEVTELRDQIANLNKQIAAMQAMLKKQSREQNGEKVK